MGWTDAGELVQCFIRHFAFSICGVPLQREMRRSEKLDDKEVAITCLDGADFVQKISSLTRALEEGLIEPESGSLEEGLTSKSRKRFVEECERRGLPLNAGKSVIFSCNTAILGGELLGSEGTLIHGRPKCWHLRRYSV